MDYIAHQAPLSMEFSRQEYCSGLPFPAPGDLPNPGIKPTSLGVSALTGRFFATVLPGKPLVYLLIIIFFSNLHIYIFPPCYWWIADLFCNDLCDFKIKNYINFLSCVTNDHKNGNYLNTHLFFILVALCSSLVCRAFSSCGRWELLSACGAGFSPQWLLLLRSVGCRCTGFGSSGSQAQLPHSMWNLPGPGIEPVSPPLAGGFLTTVPPGKSKTHMYYRSLGTAYFSIMIRVSGGCNPVVIWDCSLIREAQLGKEPFPSSLKLLAELISLHL